MPLTWSEQKPLAERFRLEVVNRRGYGKSPPPAVRQDFDEDAQTSRRCSATVRIWSVIPMGRSAR